MPKDLWGRLFDVLGHPQMDGLAHYGKRAEEISVEHLISDALVEAFDVPVLHVLAGLDMTEVDLMIVAPNDELGRTVRGEKGGVLQPVWKGNIDPCAKTS